MPEDMRGGLFLSLSICTWRGEKRKGVDCYSLFRPNTYTGSCRGRMCSQFFAAKANVGCLKLKACEGGLCIPGYCWYLSGSGRSVMQLAQELIHPEAVGILFAHVSSIST